MGTVCGDCQMRGEDNDCKKTYSQSGSQIMLKVGNGLQDDGRCKDAVGLMRQQLVVVLEGGFAAQGFDDVAVSLVAPGGAMLHQAQHRLKVAVGRGRLHCSPGLAVADVRVS